MLSISYVKVKGAQSCPTLFDPRDYTVHGILQARILEWGAIAFSEGMIELYYYHFATTNEKMNLYCREPAYCILSAY